MKVYRDDLPDWLQTALVVLGIVGLCWFMLKRDDERKIPPKSESSQPQTVKERDRFCGTSTVRCVSSAEVKLESSPVDGCPTDKARRRIESILASPMEVENCKAEALKLSAGCPQGCSLEGSAPLVVPGLLDFRADSGPNESGLCVASGSIHVTMRARCKRDTDLADIPSKAPGKSSP